jgi:hypothetical protein
MINYDVENEDRPLISEVVYLGYETEFYNHFITNKNSKHTSVWDKWLLLGLIAEAMNLEQEVHSSKWKNDNGDTWRVVWEIKLTSFVPSWGF